MTGRALDAWWDDGALAGTFVELASRQVEFRYAGESRDRPVSVSLPPEESPETPWAVFNFLDNLLLDVLGMLEAPDRNRQPDWEEVAARWLDLIRPVWYEKLQERGRRKPLLLRDIRPAVIEAEDRLLPRLLQELCGDFPAQQPVDERIIAGIVGVPEGNDCSGRDDGTARPRRSGRTRPAEDSDDRAR